MRSCHAVKLNKWIRMRCMKCWPLKATACVRARVCTCVNRRVCARARAFAASTQHLVLMGISLQSCLPVSGLAACVCSNYRQD